MRRFLIILCAITALELCLATVDTAHNVAIDGSMVDEEDDSVVVKGKR